MKPALAILFLLASAGCASMDSGPASKRPPGEVEEHEGFDTIDAPVDTLVGEPLDGNIDIEPDVDNDPTTED